MYSNRQATFSSFYTSRVKKSLRVVLLSTLLLLSQIALAVHNANHAFHDSSVYCDYFQAADCQNLNVDSLAGYSSLPSFLPVTDSELSAPLILPRQYLYALVRAPPTTSF